MGEKKFGERADVSSLLLDIKQDVWRGRERLCWCVCDNAEREQTIHNIASSVPGVVEVEKCHARNMGLDYYVDLHVGVDGNISVHEGHEIAHRVKSAIQQSDSRIADVLVHIEPAV